MENTSFRDRQKQLLPHAIHKSVISLLRRLVIAFSSVDSPWLIVNNLETPVISGYETGTNLLIEGPEGNFH